MPVFYYKAKNKNAVTVMGQVFADQKAEAVEKVSQFGLLPISVSAESKTARGRENRRRVSSRELYLFTRQLFNLIRSGVTILRSLEIK